jgi:carbonic anhydrase
MGTDPTRRQFLSAAGTALGLAALGAATAACNRNTTLNPLEWKPLPTLAPTPTPRAQAPLSGSDALTRLLEGNRRFVESRLTHPNQSEAQRMLVAGRQMPFASILCCADSRVPPELLFDQGLGDLFVLRVAGNVLNPNLLASLEYAAEHLHTPLLMVLGHKRCGAVKAALEALTAQAAAPGHLQSLVNALRSPVQAVLPAADEAALDQAIRLNVAHVLRQITDRSHLLARLVEERKLQLVGGYYDLDSGVVELIG